MLLKNKVLAGMQKKTGISLIRKEKALWNSSGLIDLL
jgi:hypothetical protein